MNDYDSDIDLAMHICHHQLYWEKKNENELDNLYILDSIWNMLNMLQNRSMIFVQLQNFSIVLDKPQ